MPAYSQVTLIGHLGHAPSRKEVGKDSVVEFSLAVNDPFRKDDPPSWFRVQAWGKTGDVAEKFLDKGSPAMVVGSIKVRQFETKNGKGTSVDVRADRIVLLGDKPAGRASETAQEEPPF